MVIRKSTARSAVPVHALAEGRTTRRSKSPRRRKRPKNRDHSGMRLERRKPGAPATESAGGRAAVVRAPKSPVPTSSYPRARAVLVLVGTVLVGYTLWQLGFVHARWTWRLWGLNGVTLAFAAAALAPYCWRIPLWLTYRPKPALLADDPRLPEVTVVVPAFNEGQTLYESIKSILGSDYPAQKLRIIVVDDGSTDDTAQHAHSAALLDPARVLVIEQPRNHGKRRALYAGFAEVRTPVFVTVDSDTVLPADSLRALVTPLVIDTRIQAVAGRIDVLNRDDNVLTRMLAVQYRLAFDVVRAAQSRLGSVFVSPGAFSAYRMSAVRESLDGWVGQRFLGAYCFNGDDHALTNVVLGQGGLTVYQSNAPARTSVPRTFKRLALMYLRWSRSNIRESTLWMAFVPRLARHRDRWPAILDGIAHFTQIPARIALAPTAVIVFVLHPTLLLSAVFSAIVASGVYSLMYLRSEWSYDAAYTGLYAVFSLLALWWLYPVALVTVRQSRWLTR